MALIILLFIGSVFFAVAGDTLKTVRNNGKVFMIRSASELLKFVCLMSLGIRLSKFPDEHLIMVIIGVIVLALLSFGLYYLLISLKPIKNLKLRMEYNFSHF